MNHPFRGFWVLLWLMIFSLTTLHAQQSPTSVPKAPAIIQSMDTMFRPAANSSGYLIIRNSDLEQLKSGISTVISEKLSVQSPQVIERVDTVYIESKAVQPSESNLASFAGDDNWIWITLAVIFMLGCLILSFLNTKNRQQMKDSIDRLTTLETDFERHKMNSIERERKLMRELIDARNEE